MGGEDGGVYSPLRCSAGTGGSGMGTKRGAPGQTVQDGRGPLAAAEADDER